MFTSLSVRNFRGFRDLTIKALDRVNLVAGRNNAGKTALLEALYLHCNHADPRAVSELYELRGISSPRISEVAEWLFLNGNPAGGAEIRTERADNAWSTTLLLLLTSAAAATKPELAALRKDFISGFRPDLLDDRKPWIFMSYKDSENTNAAAVGAEVRTGDGLATFRPASVNKLPCFILSARGAVIWPDIAPSTVAENHLFSQLEVLGRQDEVRGPLRLLEPRLADLSLLQFNEKTVLHAQLEGLQRRIPVSLMGDGFRRLLLIVLMIASAEGGVVLIDEVESGLHYSVQRDVWRAIGDAARRSGAQVFATTHSWECVVAANEAFLEGPRYDLRLHRLDQVNGTIGIVTYDRGMLEAALMTGLEIR